ncbi:hypothetical protein V6N13_146401 [Hibiscus sabdariffa]
MKPSKVDDVVICFVCLLLVNIVVVDESNRYAIVSTNGGTSVDWLSETVVVGKADVCRTQIDTVRALAYPLADPDVLRRTIFLRL